jgi:hypothetical protein
VAVAARQRHARLREPKLGPDDVNDTLVQAIQAEELDAELLDVSLQRLGQFFRFLVKKRPLAQIGRHNVIDRGKRPVAEGHVHARFPQHVESRRGGDLVNQMETDE